MTHKTYLYDSATANSAASLRDYQQQAQNNWQYRPMWGAHMIDSQKLADYYYTLPGRSGNYATYDPKQKKLLLCKP